MKKISICLDVIEPTAEIPLGEGVSLSYLKTLGHITYYQDTDINDELVDINEYWFEVDPVGKYAGMDIYGDFTYEFDYPEDDTWVKREEEIDKIL